MNLLPEKDLIRTSRIDHADWNYRPLLSWIMRRRFELILGLLPRTRVPRLLEIGFGSGVFLPELARRCDELYGIDIHENVQAVQSRLECHAVNARLSRQSAACLDFPDAFFDVIVSVSTLEFVEDIEPAARALKRVLGPNGCLIAVMPNKLALLDFALRAVTGEDPNRDYKGRRELVLPALSKYFRVCRKEAFAPIYAAYRFTKRE